jgi:hypothetical protein
MSRVRRTISREPACVVSAIWARPGLGVVLDRDPLGLGDLVDQRPGLVALLRANGELDAALVERARQLVVLEPRVRPERNRSAVTGAVRTGEQLLHEPLRAALRVRLPLAVGEVPHLAGIRAGRGAR